MNLRILAVGLCYICSFVVNSQPNDVCLSLPRQSEPTEVTQGRPGKRGAVGAIGPVGPPGPVGECTCNVTADVELLKEQLENSNQAISELVKAFGSLNATLNILRRAHPGWYTPGNGYQYLISNTTQNYQQSRSWCQSLGGDLAAVGMRDPAARRMIVDNYLGNQFAWVGLNDLESKGNFVWVDGVPATTGNAWWHPGEPNNAGGKEHCAYINWPDAIPPYTLIDVNCDRTDGRAICEKILLAK